MEVTLLRCTIGPMPSRERLQDLRCWNWMYRARRQGPRLNRSCWQLSYAMGGRPAGQPEHQSAGRQYGPPGFPPATPIPAHG